MSSEFSTIEPGVRVVFLRFHYLQPAHTTLIEFMYGYQRDFDVNQPRSITVRETLPLLPLLHFNTKLQSTVFHHPWHPLYSTRFIKRTSYMSKVTP